MMINHDELKNAFPSVLGDDIDVILNKINLESEHPTVGKFEVILDREILSVPCRQYLDVTLYNHISESELTSKQKLIMDCFFTRHHNGYVREAFLKKIIQSKEPWVVPYVFGVLGEYVIELLDVIFRNLDNLYLPNYIEFINANNQYYNLTKQRVVSYWNCYYRWLYKYKNDYVGFKILKFLKQHNSI